MSIYPVTCYGLACDECGDEMVDDDENTVIGLTHSRLLIRASEWGWGADPAISDRASCPDCRAAGCARMNHNYGPWHSAAAVAGYSTEQRGCRYCVRTEARPATLALPDIPLPDQAQV